jgi:hypothetical protein
MIFCLGGIRDMPMRMRASRGSWQIRVVLKSTSVLFLTTRRTG